MTTINLSHTAFNKGIDDVRAASQLLGTDKRRIDNRVRGFLGAGWTGVAADSFVEAWDDWKAAADEVHEALDGMGELLGVALADFDEQDADSQQALDAVASSLIDRLG